jgi:hypothetical protein
MLTKPSDLLPYDVQCLIRAVQDLVAIGFGNSTAHGFWSDYLRVSHFLSDNSGVAGDAIKYELDTKLHKIALMHSELGEMTEGVRKPCADQHCPEFTSEEIELADTFIRGFDYAGAFGLRLAEAILAKMEYNATRPYKHGKGA